MGWTLIAIVMLALAISPLLLGGIGGIIAHSPLGHTGSDVRRPRATLALEERLKDAVAPQHLFCGRP